MGEMAGSVPNDCAHGNPAVVHMGHVSDFSARRAVDAGGEVAGIEAEIRHIFRARSGFDEVSRDVAERA